MTGRRDILKSYLRQGLSRLQGSEALRAKLAALGRTFSQPELRIPVAAVGRAMARIDGVGQSTLAPYGDGLLFACVREDGRPWEAKIEWLPPAFAMGGAKEISLRIHPEELANETFGLRVATGLVAALLEQVLLRVTAVPVESSDPLMDRHKDMFSTDLRTAPALRNGPTAKMMLPLLDALALERIRTEGPDIVLKFRMTLGS